jgi:hypothetical protein
VSFAAITLRVASLRIFIVVSVYFVIDSVRKLYDTPSYHHRGHKRTRFDPIRTYKILYLRRGETGTAARW